MSADNDTRTAAEPKVTLFDPAKNEPVTMTVVDVARALWAAQAMLYEEEQTRNPEWPESSCWASFDDLVGWTHDTEMFYEHAEACEAIGVRLAGSEGRPDLDRAVLDAADTAFARHQDVSTGSHSMSRWHELSRLYDESIDHLLRAVAARRAVQETDR